MATPTLNASTDKPSYLPGDPITVTWTVVDADNATETLVLSGSDAQGNEVSVELVVNRQDPFTMDSVTWQRTGQRLTVDNTNRRATGTVPSA